MNTDPDWFIASRVRRLHTALASLPERSPGLAPADVAEALRRSCGGPRSELPTLVDVLLHLRLVQLQAGRIYLTRQGARLKALRSDRAKREVSLLIIQHGFIHTQVRELLERGSIQEDGSIAAPVAVLRRTAPQLIGLLASWPGVVGPSFVLVPRELRADIDTPWGLLPLPQPSDDGYRKAVGSRGEAYSFQYLRLNSSSPAHVSWVARDDESLGYDIEDRTGAVLKRVEVKATVGSDLRFFLSENEYKVAHDDPANYDLHFWSGIDLSTDPNTEYALLTAAGYPQVFPNLASHLSDERLVANPVKYRISEP